MLKEIKQGFEVLSDITSVTAEFGSSTINVIEGETETIADLIVGGFDKQIDGVILVKKTELTDQPENGSTFNMDSKVFMVETVKTDQYDPIWTIGYSFYKNQPTE
jgi:hypothetical protein